MNIEVHINTTKIKPDDKRLLNLFNENPNINFYVLIEYVDAKNTHCIDVDGSPDLILTIGGDGSLLKAVRDCKFKNVPFLGLNAGNLGFLTSTTFETFTERIQDYLKGFYRTENRYLLEVKKYKDNELVFEDFALNDAVLERKDIARMKHVKVKVDDEYFTTYHSNGVIVSSATGSTAYNLSVGGAILYPDSRSVVLSPICPHSLSQRPVVINDREIELTLNGRVTESYLSLDGCKGIEVEQDEKIVIKPSDKYICLVRLGNESFPKILSDKLGWK